MRKPPKRQRSVGLEWLNARVNYEKTPASTNSATTFSLTRMRRLLRDLGDPHLSCPVVHVAGTKGKGSTVTMLAAILTEAGYTVGSYLSPHVHGIEERIRLDGIPITSRELAATLDKVIPIVAAFDNAASRRGRPTLTWFEVMTAIAFLHFTAKRVGAVVLETGLGGRLDATNVCHPIVTIITSISFDHVKLLGPTITSIAREKAGIIKRHCPIISGAKQPAARRVIAEIATRRRAPLLELGRDFKVRTAEHPGRSSGLAGTEFDFDRLDGTQPRRYSLRLAGHHQAENAALAIVGAEQLRARGFRIDEMAIDRGLARATLAARIQTIARRPLTIVDAAHNVASMTALASTLRPLLMSRIPRVLVVSASGDKQIESMLKPLSGYFDYVIITRYLESPRAAPLDRLRAACSAANLPTPSEAATPREALKKARSVAGAGGIVVVTGSFFLAAEVGGPRGDG